MIAYKQQEKYWTGPSKANKGTDFSKSPKGMEVVPLEVTTVPREYWLRERIRLVAQENS